MQVNWIEVAGLAGAVLAVSGSNVLVDLRDWCSGFSNPWQPLRWIGVALEFCGLLTDKAMATGFVLGLVWWGQVRPIQETVLLAGVLTISVALLDETIALMDAGVRRLMPRAAPPGPFPIPRSRRAAPDRELMPEGTLPQTSALSEEEAFDALDEQDRKADQARGASVPE